MLLTYGGTALGDANAARFSWGRSLLRNKAGIGYGFIGRVECGEIFAACNGNAGANAVIAAIETALGVQEGDLVFLDDDGSESGKTVHSGSTLSGVRCVEGPTWSDRPGAQHQTFLSYSCAFEWETRFPGTAALLIDFQETVTLRGGGPLIVVQEYVNNVPPAAQVTIPQQGYHAIQEGSAVGYQAYPTPPSPIWAAALTDTAIIRTSSQRSGSASKNFTVRWRYAFASSSALTGNPTQWVG